MLAEVILCNKNMYVQGRFNFESIRYHIFSSHKQSQRCFKSIYSTTPLFGEQRLSDADEPRCGWKHRGSSLDRVM